MRLAQPAVLLLLCVLAGAGVLHVPADGRSPPHALAAEHSVQPVPPQTFQAAVAGVGDFVVVRLRNKFFDPPFVVIHEGDTVVWVNETKGGWHDVQSYDGLFSSPRMQWSHVFSRTFDQAGTYGYYCTPHVIDGMQGAVVVLPKGAPLPDPLPAPEVITPSAGPVPALEAGGPDTISTVAGSGGNGGLAADASLYLPEGVAMDEAGRLYIADTENCQIRRVAPSGVVVSVLGHESCGFSMGADGDLGPWIHTNHPRGVAVGPGGAVYVADTVNCRVRRVEEEGTVSTVAGTGSCRASGDGGPAVAAGLAPWGLAWDREGNLFIADVLNCRVRKVDSAGTISTVAGTGMCGFSGDGGPASDASLFFPRGIAVGEDGALYVADSENCRVRRVDPGDSTIETVAGGGSCGYAGDGGVALQAGLHPWGLDVTPSGDVLVADRENCRVRRFAPGGAIATVAGTGACGFSGDGGPASNATINSPGDVMLAPDGTTYVVDTGNCRIRRIEGAGVIDTVAGGGACAFGGDGGPAASGGAWHPMGLAMDTDGSWFYSELDTCRVRRIDAEGRMTTYAGTGVCGYSGDGGPATEARLSDFLGGLALAEDGTLFVAEGYNCRVRAVAPDGTIDTIAGTGACGFSGDGGPAREAELDFVSDVVLDGAGGLYVADSFNCRVRRVDMAGGIISTAVGDGSCSYHGENVPAAEAGIEPWGVAVGPDGDLFLADGGNCRVRRVGSEGTVLTVAGGDACGHAGDGGPALEAKLMRPYSLVLDKVGNLYVSDLRTFTVRKVDRDGAITNVAGVGIARPIDIGGYDPTGGLLCSLHSLPVPAPTYLGDGGPAGDAGLYFPYAIALDHDGHLYIGDTFDHRVRRVTCGGDIPCEGPIQPSAPSSVPPPTPTAPAPSSVGTPDGDGTSGNEIALPITGRRDPQPAGPWPWALLAIAGVGLGALGAALRAADARRNADATTNTRNEP